MSGRWLPFNRPESATRRALEAPAEEPWNPPRHSRFADDTPDDTRAVSEIKEEK